MPPGGDAVDPRRDAAEVVLDRLVAAQPIAGRSGVAAESEVIRDGQALLVRRAQVLVRVRPNGEASRDVARREVRFASLLQSFGVPVTALVEPVGQPWVVHGAVVTAWAWTDPRGRSDPYDLGLLARTLRERGAVAAAVVPTFDPFAAIEGAVAGLPPSDPDVAFVRSRCADLRTAWQAASREDPLGPAIVHGDLHRGNVVEGPGGPLLTDLELMGAGGASYDAAPAVVDVERYGGDEGDLEAFLRGFGHDPRRWSGFATYRAVYELWTAAWAVGVRERDPDWAREAARRITTLRDGVDHPWNLL